MNNVFFDTCVYHQPGIDLLSDVIENKNILFGSEMVGAVRGIDPHTGHYFDDTKRYVDALDISDEERHAIFEGNTRTVYPRLDEILKERSEEHTSELQSLMRSSSAVFCLKKTKQRNKH